MSEVKEEVPDSLDEAHGKGDNSELLNIHIPTQTKKSQKRKHLRTDFDDELDASVLEAQRAEKQRLDRLEKIKPQNDHIQEMESLFLSSNSHILPQLDLSTDDFDFQDVGLFENSEQKPSNFSMIGYDQPSTSSSAPVDLVDLTEDSDDDDCMITDVKCFAPQPVKRMRWAQAEKDKADVDQMELQHNIEAQRIKKARSLQDLESTEKCGGRLLVNAGHPPEDPDIFVIAHLTHVLQPHQLGGIRFMYDNTVESIGEFKSSEGFGCILAHSMGLGKTIQVITFTEIFLRATQSKKILIIVPVNTIQNWYSEYERWIPRISDVGNRIRQFEVYLLGDAVKSFDQRVNLIEQWDKNGGVLLIGYDMFRSLIKMTQPKKEKKGRPKLNLFGVSSSGFRDQADEEKKREDELEFETGFTSGGRVRQDAYDLLRKALLNPGPDLVVCDEGHKIKNITAEISMTLGAINTKRRIVLTGYPLQNNLMEYYCMIDFVRPKYLGTRKSFMDRFEKPIKNGQCVDSTPADLKTARQRTHVLVELVKGFVQRRTHHILKTILPESKEYVLLLRKSHIQRMLYRNFVLYAKSELKSGDATFNPLMAFSACSKFWNHPDILFRIVEQRRRNEMMVEEKKRNAEMTRQYQQQQQQMGMGMMMGYGEGGGQQFQMNHMDPHQHHHMQNQHHHHQNFHQNQNQMMMMQNGNWQNGYHQPMHNPQMMGMHPNSPFNIPSTSATPPNSGKKLRKQKNSKKTKGTDESSEEDEKETRMRYDWTYELFDKYQAGNLENGYKLMISLEILDESTRIGDKILIFSQNLSALNMLEELLKNRPVAKGSREHRPEVWEKNRNYLRLDGQTSGADREKLINRYNKEAGLYLFLISTRAGSLGINLVSANRCIIIDACWNPCHDAQAVCRVYRYGQQKKTYVYRLIMDNSMERSIFNRQISKHGLQQRVVDDAQVDANISQKELETLLMYDEALDMSQDKWDTEEWKFGDDILDKITDKMSHMFSQKPFLHESLILESEKTLSEEEKREAQLLFEQEKRMENAEVMSSASIMNGGMMNNGMNGQFANYQPQLNWISPQPNQFQSPFSSRLPPRPSPMPNTLRLSVPQQFGGGHTMTSYNNGYGNNDNINNNNDLLGGGGGGGGQMLPPRDPSAFEGALRSFKPSVTSSGACQFIITDRALCFPMVGTTSLKSVPANTEIQLVVPQRGFFIKLKNGEVLRADGTIFDKRCRELYDIYRQTDFSQKNSNGQSHEVINLDD